MKRTRSALIIVFLLLAGKIIAQPLTMDTALHPTELKLLKFSPKGQPKGNGWINVSKVTQKNDTAYYFCKGLSIYSPAVAIVATQNTAAPLEVSLHKWNWKEHSRKGTTNEKGTWMEKFKTENDFGLMVVTKQKPAEYNITIWVGTEADVEMPTDFKSFDESDEGSKTEAGKGGQSFFKKNMLYIIIGVLAIAIIFLLLNRKKKKV